jgi:glycosyltransferase involved in cell wall biosynthesis
MPTVSILMPNYNHAAYLRQSLGGACAQTRPADEILVVDDGSTDDSVAIIKEFAAKYPQLRLIENDGNKGMQYTINRLLQETTADYIVCAAADDELYPQFLEKHMKQLARYPQAGMSVSEFMVLKQNGIVVNQSRAMPDSFGLFGLPPYLSGPNLQRAFARRYIWMTSNAIVARRDAVMEVGGFIPDQQWHSDWFTYYAVGLRHGVCFVPEGLGMIRESPGGYSASGMKNFERQRKVLLAIVQAACQSPNADLRRIFRRYPSLLSVFGEDMARVLIREPRYFDLTMPYIWFLLRRAKRNSGRSWPHLAVYFAKRALV